MNAANLANSEITLIQSEIKTIFRIFQSLSKILPSFDIADSSVLPYGLKPHTRSVAWLVEQVVCQQLKFHSLSLDIQNVNYDLPDTCLHDCEITINHVKYYINIKTHQVKPKQNKNDIAAVEKLYLQYSSKTDYRLIYACVAISFQGNKICFDENQLHLFSPQFMPIYINPRNDKIQCYYKHTPELRTRSDFLTLLQTQSISIVL